MEQTTQSILLHAARENSPFLILLAVLSPIVIKYVMEIWTGSVKKMARQVDQLFEMHNQRDSDGRYRWYVTEEQTRAVDKIGEAMAAQTHLLARMEERNEDSRGRMIDLLERMDRRIQRIEDDTR